MFENLVRVASIGQITTLPMFWDLPRTLKMGIIDNLVIKPRRAAQVCHNTTDCYDITDIWIILLLVFTIKAAKF